MSRQIAVTIKKNRGGLVADNVDLNQFYTGEQAVKLGLIDGLASPQQVFKRIDRESLLSKIDFNATEKIFRMVRRLNLSD